MEVSTSRTPRARTAYAPTRPISITRHPLLTMYTDPNPPPEQVDQFGHFMGKKVTVKRDTYKKNVNAVLKNPTPARLEESRAQSLLLEHSEMERLFDDIASNTVDTPLNLLVEQHLKAFLEAVQFLS